MGQESRELRRRRPDRKRRGWLARVSEAVSVRLAPFHDKFYLRLQRATGKWTREQPETQRAIAEALTVFQKEVPDPGARVLDAGCGDGWALDRLRQMGFHRRLGVDLNEQKVSVGRRVGGHPVLVAVLHRLPLRDECMDAVYTRHTLEHVRHLEETLQEFHRILTPKGVLFVIVPVTERRGPHMQNFGGVEDLVGPVRETGFQHIQAWTHRALEDEIWVTARKR